MELCTARGARTQNVAGWLKLTASLRCACCGSLNELAPAAFVDRKGAAPVDAMHAGNQARRRGRCLGRVEVADISQCQRAELGRAEPERGGERRQRADHARMGVA